MGSPTARAIEELRNLPDNWDSYGAPRVAWSACVRAESLVTTLQNALGGRFMEPVVGPDVGGGVELFWESRDGISEVHVYVPPSGMPKVVVLRDMKLARSFTLESLTDVVGVLTTSQVLR